MRNPLIEKKVTMLVLCHIFFKRLYIKVCHAHVLPSNITVTKLFKPLNDYIPEKLNWLFCVGTDYAAAMSRSKRLLLNMSLHIFIYREMLASWHVSLNIRTSCRM